MQNTSISFEVFEKKIMGKLLYGSNHILPILRKQYEKAQIKNRKFTGVGFFTDFIVPKDVPRLPNLKSFHLGNVAGKINGTDIGLVLFIKDGVLNFLEGYTFGDDPWPDKIINYELWHTNYDQQKK
ncbi:hypothetical protein E3J79_00620 [Candidatus Dependentiae bacterium]|nr:MAG: hypothetical protein E3J79_00620 [Candidatus Dependentiae bacterium]